MIEERKSLKREVLRDAGRVGQLPTSLSPVKITFHRAQSQDIPIVIRNFGVSGGVEVSLKENAACEALQDPFVSLQ